MNQKMMTCVITGISGPTGQAIQALLLQQGIRVIGTTRLNDLPQELIQLEENKYQIRMDPLDRISIKNSLEMIVSQFGPVQIWVNVVGGFEMGSLLEDSTQKSWDVMWSLNFNSVLHSIEVLFPHFKEFGFGRLINFGSAAVEEGMALAGPYLISKSAVHTLTKVAAAELSGDITCNAILPGIIDTPTNRLAMPDASFDSWVKVEAIARVVANIINSDSNGELINL